MAVVRQELHDSYITSFLKSKENSNKKLKPLNAGFGKKKGSQVSTGKGILVADSVGKNLNYEEGTKDHSLKIISEKVFPKKNSLKQ